MNLVLGASEARMNTLDQVSSKTFWTVFKKELNCRVLRTVADHVALCMPEAHAFGQTESNPDAVSPGLVPCISLASHILGTRVTVSLRIPPHPQTSKN